MGQQINVDLKFNADTQQALRAISELSHTLQQIAVSPVNKNSLFDDAEIRKASAAATELQGKLSAAFNQKTGKLDLLKFSTDLKSAGRDINYFKENLAGIGKQGQQAFLQLAQVISQAETPMIRVSARMKEFGVTLANTAKWQLSSSVIHGFMGTIQKAYGYAQNLNRSLNDIRIVSGQSADQMGKFANEANKAARALSATTLDYTNAALVYYQQGLSDKEVKERTDLTIKMANASQQSAEIVSDQMTAVWNNFAKGSENLEHFADVMVRLGADTASSSDEIAQGLEKFVAIAPTIGLSFDNAAAALATITATTRESADTVGTALKTLFARIQGLKLGDTLEDGTDLNKYSEALEKAGVYIKNGKGELRDMDDILMDMGEKWGNLNRDEQVALAQTVAGVRQYNQLMTLMENFDFFKENIERAKNSEGSLQEQADIYAESWEAARDRVQVALENIYSKLIDDDFFISMANGLAKVIDGIGGFIDGLGGVEGLLKSIGSIFMSIYAQKMPGILNDLKQNFMIITGLGRKAMLKTQKDMQAGLAAIQADPNVSSGDKIKAEGISKVTEMQQQYIQNSRYMTDVEQQEYNAKIKNIEVLYKEAEALENVYEKMKNYATIAESRGLTNNAIEKQLNEEGNNGIDPQTVRTNFKEKTEAYYAASAKAGTALGQSNSLNAQIKAWESQRAMISGNDQEVKKLINSMKIYLKLHKNIAEENGFDDIANELKNIDELVKSDTTSYEDLLEVLKKVAAAAQNVSDTMNNNAANAADEVQAVSGVNKDTKGQVMVKGAKIGENREEMVSAREQMARLGSETELQVHAENSQTFMSIAGAAMQAEMAISSLTNTIRVFNDEESTTSEKVGALLSLFSTGVFAVTQMANAYKTLRNSKMLHTIATKIQTAANWGEVTSQAALNLALAATLIVIGLLIAAIYLIAKAWKTAQANSPEGKLKTAREASAELTEELNKTTEAANNLKSAFDDYDSIHDKLLSCKKGTEEWTEALKKNNDKVLEIMNTYPELMGRTKEIDGKISQAIQLTKDGYLEIADWAQEEMIQEANERVVKAQMADNFGKQRVREQEIEVLKNDINKHKIQTGWRTATQSEIEGYGYGATQNMRVVENKDKIIGASGRTIEYEKEYQTAIFRNLSNYANQLIDQYGQNNAMNHIAELQQELKEQNIELSDSDAETLRGIIEKTGELNTSIQENTIATNQANEALANSLLSGNKDYDESKYKQNIAAITGGNIGEASDEVIEKYKNALTNRGGWFGTLGTDDSKEIFERYAKEILEEEKGYKNVEATNYKGDGQISYKYQDAQGVWHEDENVMPDVAANELASADITKQAKEYGLRIAEQLNSFKTADEANLFTAGATGDSSWLSEEFLNKSEKEISKIIDKIEISEDVLKDMGYDASKYSGGIEEATKAYKEHLKGITASRQAFDKLSESFSEYLAEVKQSGPEAQKAAKTIADGLEEIFQTDFELDDIVDTKFIKNNEALLQDFFNGVEGSADKLQQKLGEAIYVKVGLDASQFDSDFNDLNTQIQNAYGEGLMDLEIGATLDDTQVLNSLSNIMNEMLRAGATAEQANSMIHDAFGIDVETVEDQNVKIDSQKYVDAIPELIEQPAQTFNPITGLPQNISFTGVHFRLEPAQMETEKENTSFGVKVISAKKTSGGKVNNKRITNNGGKTGNTSKGSPSGSGSGGKGGGGGKSSKPKTVQKKAPIEAKQAKDEIERYHEITKQIDNQSKLLDRLSKAKDSAYGPNKLKMMDKEIEATKTLIDLNKQHIKEIRENLKLDKERASGFGVTFDENGLINNYDEIIQQKMNEWLSEQNAIQAREIAYEEAQNAAGEDNEYDADGSIKLAIDQDKEASDKRYENFKDAISQYEETYELFNEKADELAEKYREISEKTIEKIDYKVQLKLDFSELEREFIDLDKALLGDDWNKFAEAVWLADDSVNTLTNDLETNRKGVEDLVTEYHNGQLTAAGFVEKVQEYIKNGLSNINDFLSKDADLINMYGDAISSINDELSKWTSMMDIGINRLDHFKELSSLLRKDNNSKWMNTIYSAQQASLTSRYEASRSINEMYKSNYDDLYDRWIKQKDILPEKERQALETRLHAAAEALADSEDQMLSDLEAVGEKAQEILEYNIEQAQKKLEKNLFGDIYENYMDQIDKLNLKQEEYLTNTNKMYETNKLIRQAQQDMDKTNNNRAKQQYNDYVKYIEQLQESGKLSNYELSIAQARYEVLKAQIALEDAKDAKDQVRLTRDSEGNFGYVYTANQDKVESAQQNFEDAQNKLYNIGLDGVKDYQAKSNEIYEKWLNDMQKIQEEWETGAITSESEFRARQEETTTYWQNRLKEYNELYYTGHDLLVEESYDHTADYMLKGTLSIGDFRDNTEDYLSDINGYYEEYDSTVETVKEQVGDNLSELKNKTNKVTSSTKELSDMITDKLVPSMENELETVRVRVSEYGAMRDMMWENYKAAKAYYELVKENEVGIITGNTDDYAGNLENLAGKYDFDDPLVQQALYNRYFVKLNGVDNTDYQALMDEEEVTNGTDTNRYKALSWMQKYKHLYKDWMGFYEEDPDKNGYALDIRQNVLDIYDFAQELINLGTKIPGLTTDDDRVRDLLNKRKAKLMDLQAKGVDLSGYEPIASILARANIADVSTNGYSSTALYNTGGYTGAWGPEGKLAVLHEKELVLNAQDTENILSSVNILRQISQALDNSAIWASLGLGGLNAASIGTLADQTLQQEVHISADFPNVTDHNEIEMAIDNLINAASQYAYRK